jgi:hypothetical protein
LKAPGFNPLNLKCDFLVSKIAFKCNVYRYTPAGGAQGLARHVDDHDVLVLQLGGTKRWRVWPPRGSGGDGGEGGIDENNKNNKNNNPTNLTTDELPRLYAPRPAPAGSDVAPWRCVTLRPGALLYLPRGWGHEADTDVDVDGEGAGDGPASPSVHLTLTVEVEPAMEVAGVLHAAVRRSCAAAAAAAATTTTVDGDDSFAALAEVLLHVALRELGDQCVALRRSWTAPFNLAAPGGSGSRPHSDDDGGGEVEGESEGARAAAATAKIEAFAARAFAIVLGAMQSAAAATAAEEPPAKRSRRVEEEDTV